MSILFYKAVCPLLTALVLVVAYVVFHSHFGWGIITTLVLLVVVQLFLVAVATGAYSLKSDLYLRKALGIGAIIAIDGFAFDMTWIGREDPHFAVSGLIAILAMTLAFSAFHIMRADWFPGSWASRIYLLSLSLPFAALCDYYGWGGVGIAAIAFAALTVFLGNWIFAEREITSM